MTTSSLLKCASTLIVGYLIGCNGDSSGPSFDDQSPLPGLVVSNAAASSTPSSARSFIRAERSVAYVSVTPGTLPRAIAVGIANRTQRIDGPLAPIVEGGLDPVSIAAATGDTLDVTVWMDDGSKDPLVIKVPSRRPPTVVRTIPSKGRTDVALNLGVTIVFSEPIDRSSITSTSFQLMAGRTQVSGNFSYNADSWELHFTPDNPLLPSSTYEVGISRDIRDLSGEPLDADYLETFTTGQTECGDALVCGGGTSNVVRGTVINARTNLAMPSVPVLAAVTKSDGITEILPQQATASDGTFAFVGVPNGTVRVHASMPGFDQPCSAVVKLASEGGTADVTIVPVGDARPDQATRPTRLFGTVLTVADEQPEPNVTLVVPVAGVRLYLESPSGFQTATTTSDANGAYSFCSLEPTNKASVVAVKQGYQLLRDEFVLTTNQARDIYVKR